MVDEVEVPPIKEGEWVEKRLRGARLGGLGIETQQLSDEDSSTGERGGRADAGDMADG
jgi:hypothetical protein